MRLTLGPTLDADKIKEGDDVYFECNIDAKPAIYKTSWWFNVGYFLFFNHLNFTVNKFDRFKIQISVIFFLAGCRVKTKCARRNHNGQPKLSTSAPD